MKWVESPAFRLRAAGDALAHWFRANFLQLLFDLRAELLFGLSQLGQSLKILIDQRVLFGLQQIDKLS